MIHWGYRNYTFVRSFKTILTCEDKTCQIRSHDMLILCQTWVSSGEWKLIGEFRIGLGLNSIYQDYLVETRKLWKNKIQTSRDFYCWPKFSMHLKINQHLSCFLCARFTKTVMWQLNHHTFQSRKNVAYQIKNTFFTWIRI